MRYQIFDIDSSLVGGFHRDIFINMQHKSKVISIMQEIELKLSRQA